jgi:hypothetical protein
VISAPNGPVLVSRQNPLRLMLRFDASGMTASPSGVVKALKTKLPLEYESSHGVSQAPLRIKVDFRKPPELKWTGEHAPPRVLLRTAGQILRITLSNSVDSDALGGRHNGTLELRAVERRAPSEFDAAAIQPLSPLPMQLAGGESRDVEFQCNLEHLVPGIHYFQFAVKTNRELLDRVLRIPVEVREMEVFDGVVAIDFGTSNTCCALLSDGGDVTSVSLDESHTTAPTLVRYLDLSGQEPLIETGTRVKHLAAVDESVASSTVMRLKPTTGRNGSSSYRSPAKLH